MTWALALVLSLPPSGIDAAYSAKIKEYTTEPFFLTDWVDTLPAGNGVPTPLDHIGHIVGAPPAQSEERDDTEQRRRFSPPRREAEETGARRALAGEEVLVEAALTNGDRCVGVGAAGIVARCRGDASAQPLGRSAAAFRPAGAAYRPHRPLRVDDLASGARPARCDPHRGRR